MTPYRVTTMLLVLMVCGCAREAPRARRWTVNVTTQPAPASAPVKEHGSPPIVLRGALLPADEPQAFTIELQARTTLEGGDGPHPAELLVLQIAGTLAPARSSGPRERLVSMTLERIHARLTRFEPEGTVQAFEYPDPAPPQSEALARALRPLSNTVLTLHLGDAGQVRQLRGVTQLTHHARLVMPPVLHTLRPLLTDLGFERLIRATLFPPLPSTELHASDTWQLLTFAGALDLCPTTTLQTGRITSVNHDADGLPLVTLESEGPILMSGPCSQPEQLVEGHEQVTQTLSWNDHSLRRRLRRRLVMELRPEVAGAAPASAPVPTRRIREETLICTRAGAATAAVSR